MFTNRGHSNFSEMEDVQNKVIVVQEKPPLDYLTPDKLIDLIDPKNPELLALLGGVAGIAKSLGTDLERGLSSDESFIILT